MSSAMSSSSPPPAPMCTCTHTNGLHPHPTTTHARTHARTHVRMHDSARACRCTQECTHPGTHSSHTQTHADQSLIGFRPEKARFRSESGQNQVKIASEPGPGGGVRRGSGPDRFGWEGSVAPPESLEGFCIKRCRSCLCFFQRRRDDNKNKIFAFEGGGGPWGPRGTSSKNACFRGKRHDNKILNVQLLLSRNLGAERNIVQKRLFSWETPRQ